MQRGTFIELLRREIYGGQPDDDSNITVGFVNTWLESAMAYAAKTNYTDNAQLEGIAFVNNSFYTTFKGITVIEDEQFVWKLEMPSIPLGIGYSEGISTLQFKDSSSAQISQTVVWLSENQRTFAPGMRPMPNKLLAYSEGKFVYVMSTILLSAYTANVTMISGGVSSDMDSELNIPPDYQPLVIEYIKKQLLFEVSQPVDTTNDGLDARVTQ